MNKQYPARAFPRRIFRYLNAKDLPRRNEKHHSIIKVIRLLPVYHCPIHAPFQRDDVKVKDPADGIILRRMPDGAVINKADQWMLRLGQAPNPVVFIDSIDPLNLLVGHGTI